MTAQTLLPLHIEFVRAYVQVHQGMSEDVRDAVTQQIEFLMAVVQTQERVDADLCDVSGVPYAADYPEPLHAHTDD